MIVFIDNPSGKKLLTRRKICREDINVVPFLREETITQNGRYEIPEGYAGFGKLDIDIPKTAPLLQEKTATENGRYTPDEGYEGISAFTVAIPVYDGNFTAAQTWSYGIAFMINSGRYAAAPGMTWGEWIESGYCPDNAFGVAEDGITIDGGYIYDGETKVLASDVITSEKTYTFTQPTVLISFTVAGTQYQAEEWMTWSEWISSEYCTDSAFSAVDDGITLDGAYILDAGSRVLPSSVISDGKDYTVEEPEVIISFTIDGAEYRSAEGMTWYEWSKSDYNDKYSCTSASDNVFTGNNYITRDGAYSTIVVGSDKIIAGHAYKTYNIGNTGGII